MVFFIDDNFAIDRKRIKSLLREMIEKTTGTPVSVRMARPSR